MGQTKKNREKEGKKLTPEETRVNSGGNSVNDRVNPSPAGVAHNGQGSGTPVPDSGSGGINPEIPIGKNNPPAASQFVKGKSGNPKGYPKGQLQTKTIIKYWLGMKEEIKDPVRPGRTLKVKTIDTMTLALINKARKGDVAAYRELLDRVEGKPVQSTKLLGVGDKALQVLIGFAPPGQKPPPDEK